MTKPWQAERVVTPEVAARLIETACPSLRVDTIAPLGAGWDNTAMLVNREWVFRFPRRELVVPLLEVETRLLPLLAPHVPVPVPVPEHIGAPTEEFPWIFAGYRRLPGQVALTAPLDERGRPPLAEQLGAFLKALHGPASEAVAALDLPGDDFRRLDVPHRAAKVWERLELIARAGLLDDLRPWREVLDDLPRTWTPRASCLVHGDLFPHNVLVDDEQRLSAVIDWGDVHRGDPATDLGIAVALLESSQLPRFFASYGPLDDAHLRLAQMRAMTTATALVLYGRDLGDEVMVRESLAALQRVVT